MIHLSLAFQSLLVSQTYWYVGFQQCWRDAEVKTHCPTPKTSYLKCSLGIKPTMLFCVKENTNILLLLLHGTNNGNNVTFFSYDYVLVCHASSLQYSFYISLYYTEQQSNSENRAGSCASRHSARLTSTAGFTVSEYIQKDYYCRYHTK